MVHSSKWLIALTLFCCPAGKALAEVLAKEAVQQKAEQREDAERADHRHGNGDIHQPRRTAGQWDDVARGSDGRFCVVGWKYSHAC